MVSASSLLLVFGAEFALPTADPPTRGVQDLQNRIDELRMLATSQPAAGLQHGHAVDAATASIREALDREGLAESCDDAIASGRAKDTLQAVQEVFTGVYLGAGSHLRAGGVGLAGKEITAVVSVTDRPCNDVPHWLEADRHLVLDVADRVDAAHTLSSHLDCAVNFIIEQLRGGGCVFVHCVAGVSRSAAVCIAYGMQAHQISFQEAYSAVKAKRGSVRPNKGFIDVLRDRDACAEASR